MSTSIYSGQTQEQQYNTALSQLSPSQLSTFNAAGGGKNPYKDNTPISALSSGNGATTIDNAITDHKNDMTNLGGIVTPSIPVTTPAQAPAPGNLNILTPEEAKQSKIDVGPNSGYSFDNASGNFIKSDQTAGINNQYAVQEKNIIDQFAQQTQGMDAATANIVNSLHGIYSGRIADQAEANRRELASFNTMNTRYGTSRYAPGVAQGVLTADERVGLDRINKIAMEEAGLIAQAQQSLTDKKYAAFVQQRNELSDLRKEKVKTLSDLQTQAYKAQQDKITNDLNALIHKDTVSYQEKQQAISQATLNETIRKDKVAELQKAADLKVKTDAAALLSGAMASPVVKVNGVANPADQEKFLSAYTPQMQLAIKGVADYTIDPNSASKRAGAGISPLQLETLAKAYNSDYRAGNYAAINTFLKSWASGGNNSVVQSANTVVQHLSELAGQAEKLGNASTGALGPFTSKYNSGKQWLNEGASDPNVFKYKQTAMLVATEMAKIMKNGSGSSAAPSTEEIDHQLGIMTTGLSPSTAKALIENSISLMGDRLNTARENYINVVGTPPNSVLYPSAQNALKGLQDKGYAVDLSSLSPSAYSGISDADLIGGIVNPTSSVSDPSSYFSGLMDIINGPAPVETP